jgi:phytoene synthase
MALWALDLELAAAAEGASEPMLGEIKLAWWREALVRLDSAPPPPQPLLREIAAQVLPLGVTGAALSALEDRWVAWLAGDTAAAADTARLFDLAGELLGEGKARRPLIGLARLANRDRRRADAGLPPEPAGALPRQGILLRAVALGR